MKIGIFVEVWHNGEAIYGAWLYEGDPVGSPSIVLFDNLKDADAEAENQRKKISDYQSWTRYSDIRISAKFFSI